MNRVQRKCVMTTSWDDGHPLDLRVAELLAKYGLTGTFYVPRSSQKAVMNRSQICGLANSFELGAHTLEHLAIDRLSDLETRAQLCGSREWIEEVSGKSCRIFCFPGGRFHSRQLPFLLQAGFQSARTVELLSLSRPRCVGGLYLIPTTIQAFPHGAFAYARNAAKRFSSSALANLSVSVLSKGWVALASRLLSRAAEQGGVFHLWGHSWEIEERGEWKNIEALFGIMSSWRERFPCVTNGELCGHPAQILPKVESASEAVCAERTV